MNQFLAFSKKEILENVRTYKILLLFSIFTIIGMLSPLTAKLFPNILKAIETADIKITIPNPTYMDAYTQFFKNITQVGFISILLIFNNIMYSEFSKGTLIILLSKGLSRWYVILSKIFIAILLWSFSFIISSVINLIYTNLLFGNYNFNNLLLSCFCIWIFGIFIISIIFLANIIILSGYGGLMLSLSTLGSFFIFSLIPKIAKYNPFYLVTNNIISNDNILDINICLIITIVLSSIFILFAGFIFNKKEI